MSLKATIAAVLASFAVVFFACGEQPRSIPTNSLAFHLQSLGRTPTVEEREIIEAALILMQRHQIRTDLPLRSIRRDAAKKEWVLAFDSHHPDGGFDLFLTGKDARYVEVRWPLADGRWRYPAEIKRKTR
jgi:hypothetical protein